MLVINLSASCARSSAVSLSAWASTISRSVGMRFLLFRLAARLVNRREVRLGEDFGLEHFDELLARHEAFGEDQVVDLGAGAQGFLSDLARARVADVRVEGGDQRRGFVEQSARAIGVGLDAFD